MKLLDRINCFSVAVHCFFPLILEPVVLRQVRKYVAMLRCHHNVDNDNLSKCGFRNIAWFDENERDIDIEVL